jgi:predicted permease
MRPLGELFRRLRAIVLRRRLERDLDDELAFHLAMRQAELRETGLTTNEADITSRRRFGNPALLKEQTRDAWLFPSIEALSQDIRFAVRSLLRSPGFALVAVLTLALGIGITTAMFTLVDSLVLRPVPFRGPDDLASIYMGGPTGGRTTLAPAVLRAWRESQAFSGAEAAVPHTALIESTDSVATRGMARVTPGIFDLLGGVQPVRGRLFDRADGRGGTDDRVLLSEDLWRTLYHGDASIVGRRVVIDGESLLVVGILPREFRFPRWDTVIWRALDFTAVPITQPANFPMVYVRFARGVPRADALRMATDAARAADARNAKLVPRVNPLAGNVRDPYYQRAVPLLAGGVLLVFLVLCANVSSLLLARLTERQREFSMRSALGASRGRVIRQAFVETAVMSGFGLIAGIALAWTLVSLARVFLPESLLLRTLNPLNLDVRSLGIASAAGVVAMFAAGIFPAWIGTRVDPIQSLRLSERGGTETRGAQTLTRGLLIAEIALACTLLVGATVLVRSFINLARADRGLDAEGVITVRLSFRPAFRDPAARAAVASSVEEHLRQLPVIAETAWSVGLPPFGGIHSWGDWQSDLPGTPPVNMEVDSYNVGADFFSLYGIELLRGRTFESTTTERQVLVGERFAKALWPDTEPVGRSFTFDKQRFEVIGVVREIHHPSLNPHFNLPEFYTPFSGAEGYGSLNIRCRNSCPDVALLHQRIGAIHPELTVNDADRLEDVYFEQLAQPRATAALGFSFAAIAVLAAAGGLFSVLTYSVGRRKREFGIRTALGASSSQIRGLVLRDGVVVALCGISIGTVAAWSLARALASLQYGVSLNDPISWSLVLGVIALITFAASWRPAQLAMRTDPVVLLKDE